MTEAYRHEREKLGWAVAITTVFLWGLSCNKEFLGWPTIPHIPFVGDVLVHIFVIQTVLIGALGSIAYLWMRRQMHPVTAQLSHMRQQPSLPLIAASVGVVPLQHLFLLIDERPYAVCLGMWQPAVYVSTGLLAHASPLEVRAVLAHEECHRQRRDPLRLLLCRGIAAGCIQRRARVALLQRMELRAEVRADRFARSVTSTAWLAGALLHVLQASHNQQQAPYGLPFPTMMGLDGIKQGDALRERLLYLSLSVQYPLPPRLLAQFWSQYGIRIILPSLGWVGIPAILLAMTNLVTLPHELWPVVSCVLHL